MPLYEEKLISPLAVRFTQQRIRTTFKDGREVEATIKEINALTGRGDYDIILDAPFPAIEVIRWKPNGRKAGGGEHWFSFDNRRLYCLQRLAAAHWPKRVAAKVEVLYADAGTIRKKLDSQTEGLRVTIGHAFATADELTEWSWRQAVQARAPPGNFTLQAEACIKADDAKTSVHDLMDVPEVAEEENSGGKMCSKANANTCGIGTDTAHSNQPSFVLQTPVLEDQPLTNLIAQFVKLKADECVQPRDQVADATALASASEHDDKQLESDSTVSNAPPTVMDGQQLAQTTQLPANVMEGTSLTGLIGQLLKIETGENAYNHVTDDATSTHLSEDEASVGSHGEISSPAPSMFEGFSSNESSVKHEDVEPDLPIPSNRKMPQRKQKCPPKKADPRMVDFAQQSAAQWQMHQWHVHQWQAAHAAHMAHWQRASYAFHAQQAIQSQARPGRFV
jgi:hypothetical protein